MKTKLPNFVTILILTLVTTLAWISFTIYRAVTIKPDPVVPAEISKPLTPTLDQDTINGLKTKLYFNDNEIPEIAPTK